MFRPFRMLMRTINRISVLIGIWLCFSTSVYANFPAVSVTLETSTIYEKNSEIIVNIKYSDMSFYNDQCYLSYHILDTNGEMVRYENNRGKIVLDESGEGTVSIGIDLSGLKEKNYIVQFDIVDELNQYWYLDNENIKFNTSEISCNLRGIDRVGYKLIGEVRKNPGIFAINLIVFITAIVMIDRWGKTWHE